MSEWHINWQNKFPEHFIEIPIGPHRADAITTSGHVVEFQHSALSIDEIGERERFYGERMVWVWDAVDAEDSGRLDIRRWENKTPNYRTFRWKHARKSIGYCARPVFLDIGHDRLLHLGLIGQEAPVGGWGMLVSHAEFIARALADNTPGSQA